MILVKEIEQCNLIKVNVKDRYLGMFVILDMTTIE